MQLNRIGDIKPYGAPGHFDVETLRMQGLGASDAKNFSVGLSHFEPGGGCDRSASPPEKVYVVVSGELTVIFDDQEVTLRPLDSLLIESNEARAVENRGNEIATVVVIVSAA